MRRPQKTCAICESGVRVVDYKDERTGKEIGTHRNFSNPYWVINENPNDDVKDRLIAAFAPKITFNKWLQFNGRAGADVIITYFAKEAARLLKDS